MLTILMLVYLHFNQPYTLYVDHTTPDMLAICYHDSNCMDIVETNPDVAKMRLQVARQNMIEDSGCTTDSDCCAKYPDLNQEFCGGK